MIKPNLSPLDSSLLGRFIKETWERSFNLTDPSHLTVIADRDCPSAIELAQAYQTVYPAATHILFNPANAPALLAHLESLPAGHGVALIQSSSFRLNAFRLRVELFKQGLSVIEYPHLNRLNAEQWAIYQDSIDPRWDYYHQSSLKIVAWINALENYNLITSAGTLSYQGKFEDPKLNIGDYTGLKNRGGQWPIGEVFTEPKDLTLVNGSVGIFAFGNAEFKLEVVQTPITLIIENGEVVDTKNAPASFLAVLDQIRASEGITVREFGIGLNPAFSPTKTVSDVGMFERMLGIHLSLGGKHAIYAKPGLSRRHSRFHVDVFVAGGPEIVESILAN